MPLSHLLKCMALSDFFTYFILFIYLFLYFSLNSLLFPASASVCFISASWCTCNANVLSVVIHVLYLKNNWCVFIKKSHYSPLLWRTVSLVCLSGSFLCVSVCLSVHCLYRVCIVCFFCCCFRNVCLSVWLCCCVRVRLSVCLFRCRPAGATLPLLYR
jgi:hypothetical protein